MNHITKTGVATLAVGCCAFALTAPQAQAATPAQGAARLATIQQKAATAISSRLTSLNAAITSVTANAVITTQDKAALLSTLNSDLNGLTALGKTIAADTTAAQAATDAATIYTGYRVYALALPQVRYAAALDALTGKVLPKLNDAKTKLTDAIAAADPSKNTAAVQAAMADLAAKIDAIGTATNGSAATVLAYTPAQYNANHALLSAPRQSLVAARANVKAARADIAVVVGALK